MESVRTLTAGPVLMTIQCETLALCYIAWSVGMLQSKLEGVQIPRISGQIPLEEQILPRCRWRGTYNRAQGRKSRESVS